MTRGLQSGESSLPVDARRLGGAWVIERRADRRVPVSWGVRWIIGDCIIVLGCRVLDAARHGLRLEVPLKDIGELARLLKVGDRHRLEILPGRGARLSRVARLCHVTAASVGFEVDEALPVERLRRGSDTGPIGRDVELSQT